jgi:hypothetical protein
MAFIQIPNLPAVIGLAGDELFEGVQAGTSVKISLSQIIAATRSGLPTTLPIPVILGGTGVTTLTGYVKGNGTDPFTASDTIPNTDITGLGTMSVQNANAVAITGGTAALTGASSVTVSSASPALTITQTGAGAALLVEDSTNPDSTPFIVDAIGAVGIGVLTPTFKLDVLGSILASGPSTTSVISRTGTNTDYNQIRLRSTDTDSRLESFSAGTGVVTPITMYAGGAERFRVGTSGQLGLGGANYGTSGQTIVSAGSAAAPAWGAIGAAGGGTGITTYAIGDILFASGTTTLSTLADVATGNALISGGVGVAPSYGKIGLTTHVSGTLPAANGGTGVTTAPAEAARILGYTSTATAAGTTVLTNTSTQYQLFTGVTTQTITLPVTSTLGTGWSFHIVNNSTGSLTVNSSGGNLVTTIISGVTAMVTCIGTTLTTAADWEAGFTDFQSITGTGANVLADGATMTNGVFNGTVGATTPATGIFTTVSDAAGNVRDIVNNAKVAAYILAATDNGEMINITTGGVTVNSGIFSAGNNVTIYNNSAASQTVTQGAGVTLRLAGSATTGNRTLAQRGICTIVCVASNEFVVSGAGVT